MKLLTIIWGRSTSLSRRGFHGLYLQIVSQAQTESEYLYLPVFRKHPF